MVAVTAYGLSHPELGLVEADPIVHAYISEYGPVVGLLNASNFLSCLSGSMRTIYV